MKRTLILFATAISLSVMAAPKKKQPLPAVEQSTVVVDQTAQQVVHDNNADSVHSMASITKLMTAMVVLDQTYNLDREITLKQPYYGKRIYTVKELLDLTLIRSDNHAAEILSKSFHGGRDEFIEAMNRKAWSLNMLSARFADPTGLSADNSATAKDIAKMVAAAGQYPDIRRSTQKTVEVNTQQGRKIKTVSINNTNKDILSEFDNILVSKTGTTSRAGKCLAMLVEKAGHVYAVVILGEPSKVRRDQQAKNLLQNHLVVSNEFRIGYDKDSHSRYN